MESVVNWFQDWSDACRYANECAPDLSFLSIREPWSAFLAIAIVFFAVWLLNEKGLQKILRAEGNFAGKAETPPNLTPVIDHMRGALTPGAGRKQAA